MFVYFLFPCLDWWATAEGPVCTNRGEPGGGGERGSVGRPVQAVSLPPRPGRPRACTGLCHSRLQTERHPAGVQVSDDTGKYKYCTRNCFRASFIHQNYL